MKNKNDTKSIKKTQILLFHLFRKKYKKKKVYQNEIRIIQTLTLAVK